MNNDNKKRKVYRSDTDPRPPKPRMRERLLLIAALFFTGVIAGLVAGLTATMTR